MEQDKRQELSRHQSQQLPARTRRQKNTRRVGSRNARLNSSACNDSVLNSCLPAASDSNSQPVRGSLCRKTTSNPSSVARAAPGVPACSSFRQAGKAGARALRQKGHVSPSAFKRGMGAGVRAAAGLIAPGSRRVIVKARYTRIVGGDLGAARAHIKYILRDGVTREGMAGHLYDPSHDEADGSTFLARSKRDPTSSGSLSRPRTAPGSPTSSPSSAISSRRWSATSRRSWTG